MSRRAAIWALGALLGIVVTAAITWATSRLTGQHIGLSSEPLSAGRSLAPSAPRHSTQRYVRTTTTTTVTRILTNTSTNGAAASSTTTAVITHATQTTVREPQSSSPPPGRARDDGRSRSSGRSGGSSQGPDD